MATINHHVGGRIRFLCTRAQPGVASRGALIVFEGVDRGGKTTQARRLVERIEATGKPATYMRFPDRDTTLGQMISSYLERKAELDDHAIHLLFAANRWERIGDIIGALRSGTTVVMDRYSFSGVAFSAAKDTMEFEWCKQAEEGLPRPDLTLFMEVASEEAESRGGFGAERYESTPFQERVRAQFARLRTDGEKMEVAAPVWKTIDAVGSIETVGRRVEEAALPLIEEVGRGGAPLRALWSGRIMEEGEQVRLIGSR